MPNAKQKWVRKRSEARTRGVPLGRYCPAWLTPITTPDSKRADRQRVIGFEKDSRKCRTVRLIFRWTDQGVGVRALVRRLDEQIQTLTGAERWSVSSVAALLRNVAVLGHYQPGRYRAGKRTHDGDVIRGYYPAIISQELFDRVNRIGRCIKPGKGTGVANLFVGLLHHPNGSPWHVRSGSHGKKRYLVAFEEKRCKTEGPSFPLPILEAGILSLLREVDPQTALPGDNESEARLQELDAERIEKEIQLNRLRKKLPNASDVDAVVQTLREMQQELQSINDEADQIRRQSTTPFREAWSRLEALTRLARQNNDTRTRLRSAIGQVIERIDLSVHVDAENPRRRWARIAVRFAGGFIHLWEIETVSRHKADDYWTALRGCSSESAERAKQWLSGRGAFRIGTVQHLLGSFLGDDGPVSPSLTPNKDLAANKELAEAEVSVELPRTREVSTKRTKKRQSAKHRSSRQKGG